MSHVMMPNVESTHHASDTTISATRGRRTPAAIVMIVVAMVSLALTACTATPAEYSNTTALNAVRAAVGLPELTRSAELDAKAKAQADRMAKKGTIFHSSNLAAGVTEGWSQIGENVALAGSVDDAQRALEASPGHYANMVNPAFNQVGIGITVRNGITYVVQVFVSR